MPLGPLRTGALLLAMGLGWLGGPAVALAQDSGPTDASEAMDSAAADGTPGDALNPDADMPPDSAAPDAGPGDSALTDGPGDAQSDAAPAADLAGDAPVELDLASDAPGDGLAHDSASSSDLITDGHAQDSAFPEDLATDGLDLLPAPDTIDPAKSPYKFLGGGCDCNLAASAAPAHVALPMTLLTLLGLLRRRRRARRRG